MAWKKSSLPPEQRVPGALIAIQLHTALEKQDFYSENCPSFQERSFSHSAIFQVLARLQRASVFGTGFDTRVAIAAPFFQPQSNPKYHCSKCLYGSLALFETPSHALQLVENTLLT